MGRPKTSTHTMFKKTRVSNEPSLFNYPTAASTSQGQSFRTSKKSLPVRQQDNRFFLSLDNRGMCGQSVAALAKLEDPLTVVPLPGEDEQHGEGPVQWGFYRGGSTKHASGKGNIIPG